MLIPSQRKHPYQSGLSMVELMIAIALGLLLTAGVMQVFVGSKHSYEFQRELSRLQENGRFAMEFLARDIRQADFWGCLNDGSQVDSIITGAGSADVYAAGLAASDSIPSTTSGYQFQLGPLPDSITLQGARLGGVSVSGVVSAGATSLRLAELQHPKGVSIDDDDILLISDCNNAVIFQVTDTTSGTSTVWHAATGSNASASLGQRFEPDAKVYAAESIRYWIREGASGQPALVRGNEGDDWQTGGSELVDGVDNLQFLFGEDTDGDGAPNYFATAGNVDMDNVVSVQVHLLLRSIADNMLDKARSVDYYGESRVNNDRRIRRAFTSTVALRNRLN